MKTPDDFGVPPVGNDKLPPLEEMFERCEPYEYESTKLMCIGKSKRFGVPVIRRFSLDIRPACTCVLVEVSTSTDTKHFLAQHVVLQCACPGGNSPSLLAMCNEKMIRSERIQTNQWAGDRKDSCKETEDRGLRHFLAMLGNAADQGYKPVHSSKDPNNLEEVEFHFCPCWASVLAPPVTQAAAVEPKGQKRPASPTPEEQSEEPCAKRSRAEPSDVKDTENTQIEE